MRSVSQINFTHGKVDVAFLSLSALAGFTLAALVYLYAAQQHLLHLTTAQNNAKAPLSYSSAVDAAAPAVISLWAMRYQDRHANTSPTSPFPSPSSLKTSQGSGIIANKHGYVITNYHVVRDAIEIIVRLPNRQETVATLIGSDPASDIAVLRLKTPHDLPFIRFGDDRELKVGDQVLAIGHPFDVGLTVTQGIVSAKSRGLTGFNSIEEFIQTDAAINPGNSGGALVNSIGELVGLNTAVYQGSKPVNGISFAIPAYTLRKIFDQIIEFGEVRRGWLGIQVSQLWHTLEDNTKKTHEGVLISGVYRDSPAAKAGLLAGDLILSINQKPIHQAHEVQRFTWGELPDTIIEIKIIRQNQPLNFKVTLQDKPEGASTP